MIQIIGYMVAGYGAARLLQTSAEAKDSWSQLVGYLGVGLLVLLAILLTNQASEISGL